MKKEFQMAYKSIRLANIPIPNSAFDFAVLTINRPDFANAFNGELMHEITQAITDLANSKNTRGLIIKAEGKHFSAGADLNWMKEAKNLSQQENKIESNKLTKMFDAISQAKFPTVSLVNGATYGGAVGIVACCDVSIGFDTARFCLSEVKIGLLPAVILPYLKRRMLPHRLNRYAITANVFSAKEALEAGLLDFVGTPSECEKTLQEQLNLILAASPSAQAAFKKLNFDLEASITEKSEVAVSAIANARTSNEGQSGLQAFFDKKPAPWVTSLDEATIQEIFKA